MAGIGTRQHSKLPPDARVLVRDTGAPIQTEDIEELSPKWLAENILRVREALGEIARQAENHGDPVDEYNTCPLSGTATTSLLTILPTYDFMPEKIVSILVAGPASSQVTITLGDRIWNVVIPATGILPIGPVALILGRSDVRQLTSATPGTYFLELMGFADRRFKI